MAKSIKELLGEKKMPRKVRNICITLDSEDDKKLRMIAKQECCGFATLVRSITKKYMKAHKEVL